MKLTGYIDKKLKYSKSNRNTLLIGDGGQSKSYQLIDLFNSYITNEKVVPIYVPLCESGTKEGGYSILNFIYREYISDFQESTSNYEKKLISMFRNADHVKYLIICDGYNELLESFSHQAVSATITKEIKQLSDIENVYLIISSRYILTGALFGNFDTVNVCNLSNEQIKLFVPNIENENEQLVELLRSPFYLTRFLEYKKDTSENAFSNSSVTAGELLYSYLIEHIPKKYEKEHSLDSKSPVLRKLIFCLTKLVPEFSAYMVSNKTHSISITEMSNCYRKIQSPHTENWSIVDLLENYIIPCNLMYGMIQSESNYYLFCHENYQEFFAAIWWTNNTKRTEFSEELMQFPISVQIKKYIGDILKENRFENKKDHISEPSPIELILEKNRGIINNKVVQRFNSECIEIMKISRHNSITANYSELDLSQCRFIKSNCQNSSFEKCVVVKDTFISSYNEPFSDIGLESIWTNGELLVRVYHDGEIIATNIIDGTQIYYIPPQNTVRCSDVYIDEKQIIYADWGDIIIYETLTGNLIGRRKAVNLLKDQKSIWRPLLRCVAEIYRLYSSLENRGKIYVIEGTFNHGDSTLYDQKHDLFLVIQQNRTEVFDTSYEKIGELETKRYSEYRVWNMCQNGWLIGNSDEADELIFQQIATNPLRIFKTIKFSVDIKQLQLVYISSKGDYSVVLDKELNVTIIDLSSGSYASQKVPCFKAFVCNKESFCIDDNNLVFYYDGFDFTKTKRRGICVYDYHNNSIRFKPIELEPHLNGVYIMSGEFGYIIFCRESIHLINRSLVEISVVRENRYGTSHLVASGNQFHYYSGTNKFSYLCSTSNGKTSISYNKNKSKTIESYEEIDDFYIAKVDCLIHKSGANFINCTLAHHFMEPPCDIVESKISDQYAIIKYNLDSPEPNIEVLTIEKYGALEAKKAIFPFYNHNDSNTYDLFSRSEKRDSKSEIIEDLNPHILVNSFQFVNGNFYCFFDNLYYTSLIKIDINNASVDVVIDLSERYVENFVVNEEFIISYCSESQFVEPTNNEDGNTVFNKPTCSIDTKIGIVLMKSGKHFNFDLSNVYGNHPDKKITGGIGKLAFSNESKVLAVQQHGTNSVFFFRFIYTDDNARFEFIKRIDIMTSTNYQGCDFNGVNLDSETIQCLLDNGGHL